MSEFMARWQGNKLRPPIELGNETLILMASLVPHSLISVEVVRQELDRPHLTELGPYSTQLVFISIYPSAISPQNDFYIQLCQDTQEES